MDEVINLVNTKVMSKIPQSERKTFTLTEIVTISTALITLFQQCPDLKQRLETDAEKALAWIRHPNVLNKARLLFAIRRQAINDGTWPNVKSLVKYVHEAARDATASDIETLTGGGHVLPTSLGDNPQILP